MGESENTVKKNGPSQAIFSRWPIFVSVQLWVFLDKSTCMRVDKLVFKVSNNFDIFELQEMI